MTGPPETLELLDVDPRLRPLVRAMAVPGPSWWTVLRLELRKAVDTRASRAVLLAVLVLALGALGYELVDARAAAATDAAAVSYPAYLARAFVGVAVLLPVVGVLATTSEWSQRTALSTFTLVPRRGRVLAAEVVAALLVVLVVSLATAALALGGAVLGAWWAGVPAALDGGVDAVLGELTTTLLLTLTAAGLGALVGTTAAGLVAFYVLPLGVALAVPRVLGDAAPWVDAPGAFADLAARSVASWPQVGTAVALWVVLPLAAGAARSLSREVV